MPKIAFVTCVDIPEPDVDESGLMGACQQAGIDAEVVAWDDPGVDWSAYHLAVVRSAWNYYEKPDAFRGWIGRVSDQTRLWNDAGLMLRTLHKRYLLELAQEGVPIVPTRILEKGREQDLRSLLNELKTTDFVVKPAVSAASFMTKRFAIDEASEAERFTRRILDIGDAMVQPFMTKVQEGGEVSLVHIDGVLTHAVQKFPRFIGQEESVSQASVPTSQDQCDLAASIVSKIAEPWLYARVDLMQTDEGKWVLSELEVIEPSLFLTQHPPALARMVASLRNLLND